MRTSSATQLDPAEKDKLMRCNCGFWQRTGLSKNNCPSRYDGAFLHFVTTSECAISWNFVNSCSRGCERAGLKKYLCQCAAKQGDINASIQDFEVTFESTPQGTQLRKASDYVRMPQWVQVAPEGGRREDAQARPVSVSWHLARRQAWQADGDDECGRRRFDQAHQNVSV